MEILGLSVKPGGAGCFMLKTPRLNVLLDCGLDAATALHFIPLDPLRSSGDLPGAPWYGAKPKSGDKSREHVTVRSISERVLLHEPFEYRVPRFELVDPRTIDLVLISNFHTILALPYLTRNPAFRGEVLATEPTIRFGQQLMDAMLAHESQSPRKPSPNGWKAPEVLAALSGNASDAALWQPLYSAKEAHAAVERCTAVSYNEKRSLLGYITVTAHPSGYGIGSANWVMQTPEHKVVYLAQSSNAASRHPLPLELDPLQQADVCVLAGLSRTPEALPDQMVSEMLGHVTSSVSAGAPVLLPVHSTGLVYDLIEIVIRRLAEMQLGTVPVYFVSPSAKASLSYANICCEWLCEEKGERSLIPEWPFVHAEYVRTGILKVFPSLTAEFTKQYREPCVVFADQVDLRSGASAQLLKMWQANPNASCLLTSPDCNYDDVCAPYVGANIKIISCPIDPALRPVEARALLSRLAPKCLALPAAYYPSNLPSTEEFSTDTSRCNIEYRNGSILEISSETWRPLLKTLFEKATIAEPLAKTLVPVRIDHQTSAVGVNACLTHHDYDYRLNFPAETSMCKRRKVLFGSLQTPRLIQVLSQRGFRDVKVTRKDAVDVIRLVSYDAAIELSPGNTEILVKDNETLRLALRDAVLSLLTEL